MSDGAIILAAGKGQRMRSATPKVLHEVLGLPLLGHPLRLARELGLDPIVVVIGHGGEQVRAALTGEPVVFVEQREQLGTGHAVRLAMRPLLRRAKRTFVLYGDVPLLSRDTLRGLRRSFRRGGDLALCSLVLDDATGYGRLLRDAKGHVERVVEHKDATPAELEIREVNAGIYLADTGFLARATRRLQNDNAKGEYYLTDVVAAAARRGRVGVHRAPAEETLGVNSRRDLAAVAAVMRRRIIEGWMDRGVTFADPASTFVDPRAKLGTDVTVHAGCHILGASRIESLAVLEPGVILRDSFVGRGTRVRAYSYAEDAVVGENAVVGPFARLRPKTRIGARAEVGNFIELKNTALGDGAKAHHVGYLGDSDIGAASNIGAGTITCNYDGARKHATHIGHSVFIGSNATLVAPLRIGDEAYVAAGSTVNRDVPGQALAVGRARQENKEGYVPLLRRRLAARGRKE